MAERTDEVNAIAGGAGQDDREDTAAIRADIEQTRAEMSETIDEIQGRLDPANLRDQAVEKVKEQIEETKETVIGKAEDMVETASETAAQAGRGLIDVIRRNPIPVALIGVGIGWLAVNARSDDRKRARTYGRALRQGSSQQGISQQGSSQRNLLSRGRGAVGGTVSKAQSSVRDLTHSAQQTAGELVGQAQQQAERAKRSFQTALSENPLAIGAVALAAGAVVGALLPHTDVENRMLGEARDSFLDSAHGVAKDALDTVQRTAGEISDKAQQAANEHANRPDQLH